MKRSELITYLDGYLQIAAIKDYGPQGLQVEGREQVNKIVGLVDAQLPCLEAALASGADMLLVHHGIFWGPTQPLAGSFGRLVRSYFEAEINLYAAHLALDAHPEVGNNAELARRLGLEIAAALVKLYPGKVSLEANRLLIANRRVMTRLEAGDDPRQIEQESQERVEEFLKVREKYLVY